MECAGQRRVLLRHQNQGITKEFGIETPPQAAQKSCIEGDRKTMSLHWNQWVRNTHRWLSIAFTVAVIVNGIAIAQNKYTRGLGLVAVIPLAFQFFTGLYLFVLPYAAKWRSGRRTD
jgi:hypothetical protein